MHIAGHFEALGDGVYEFKVRARDLAGNMDGTPARDPCRVDIVPPAAPVISRPANGTARRTTRIELSGSGEPHSVITVRQGAATIADSAGSWAAGVPYVIEGVYEFRATAHDAAGHVSPVSSPHVVLVDLTSPDTIINQAPAPQTDTSDAQFVFSSNESAVVFECSLSGRVWEPCCRRTRCP